MERVDRGHRVIATNRYRASRRALRSPLGVRERAMVKAAEEAALAERIRVGGHPVGGQPDRAVFREEMQQGVEHTDHRSRVSPSCRLGGARLALGFLEAGALAGALVRSRVESVDKAGLFPDDGCDTHRIVLRPHERLEVIDDEAFVDRVELGERRRREQERVPAQPRALPRDRRRRAAERSRELAMPGSRLQSREDGLEELGAFQIVGGGERSLREAVLADDALVSRDPPAIATCVRAVVLKPEALTGPQDVCRAVLARTEARHESPLNFDGLNRPVHEPASGNDHAGEKPRSAEGARPNPVRQERGASADGRAPSPFFAPRC